MGRMIFFSLILAALGLLLTVAGVNSPDPDSPFYSFRWLGPLALGGGVLLMVLGFYFGRR
jgi:hypothetical protein